MASTGAARRPQTSVVLPDGAAVVLRRHPTRPQPGQLQAWDAADLLLLRYMAGQADDLLAAAEPPTRGMIPEGAIVVAGDGFGAITLGAARHYPQVINWSDDVLAQDAAAANLRTNGIDPEGVTWMPSTQTPVDVAALLIKVPRTRSMLLDLLARVRPSLRPGAVIVGTGMTRNIHSATVDAFTELIGPTVTTKAWRKARLILSEADVPAVEIAADQKLADRAEVGGAVTHDVDGITAVGMPGVFSRRKLDRGTQALLQHLPISFRDRPEVIDLGCGNGILGTTFAARTPGARLTFIDSSHLAIASARRTFEGALGDVAASFRVADGLEGTADASADVILCNPPFHQDHVVGDDVAWRMFTGAHRVLRPGGKLAVVGNRHLGHHARLGKIFGDATVVSRDPAFVVVVATRA